MKVKSKKIIKITSFVHVGGPVMTPCQS